MPVPPSDEAPREEFVQVGVVAGAHGRLGQIRIAPSTDNAERFQPGSVVYIRERPYTVRAAVASRQHLLVRLEGVDAADAARALAQAPVEVPAAEVPPLPKGSYYHFQVLDMAVYDVAGAHLGRLEEVLSTGANDVYLVRGEETELLVPALEGVVVAVDVEGRRMTVDPPLGLEPRPLSRGRGPRPRSRRGRS